VRLAREVRTCKEPGRPAAETTKVPFAGYHQYKKFKGRVISGVKSTLRRQVRWKVKNTEVKKIWQKILGKKESRKQKESQRQKNSRKQKEKAKEKEKSRRVKRQSLIVEQEGKIVQSMMARARAWRRLGSGG
jgi:hypothetical protein